MGKRRNTSSDTEIKKKIRKLELKLQRKRRLRIISSTSSDESNDQIIDEEDAVNDEPDIEQLRPVSPTSLPTNMGTRENFELLDLPPVVSPLEQSVPTPSESLSANPVPEPSSAQNGENEECPLEDDILQLLGDAPQSEVVLGKEIHKEIAGRWQIILKNGLSKEVKEKLTGQYLIPANCNLLLAPILNPEAKAAVPEMFSKRDTTMFQKQNQIGIALAALSTVMELVISNETSKQKLLQPLSDACRILCDSHNAETKTRRGIFLNAINTGLRETLANTNRDKYLFGEDVSEKLKIAKNVQKTGESLQKVIPKPSTKNTPQYKNKNHLNSKGNLRRPPNRVEGYQRRAPPPPPSTSRAPGRSSHHPPPATRSRSPSRRQTSHRR